MTSLRCLASAACWVLAALFVRWAAAVAPRRKPERFVVEGMTVQPAPETGCSLLVSYEEWAEVQVQIDALHIREVLV